MTKNLNNNEDSKIILTQNSHAEVKLNTVPSPELDNSSKLLAFTNSFLFKYNLFLLLIDIYLCFQNNIFVNATGYLPLLPQMMWYYILATGFIFLRVFLIFLTERARHYIAHVAPWHEKKKKRIFLSLTAFNVFTSFFNFPLLTLFYSYCQNKEILVTHWLFGTFRRELSEKEQNTSCQDTFQDLLDKCDDEPLIKDQLFQFSQENCSKFSPVYKAGSEIGNAFVTDAFQNKRQRLVQSLVEKSTETPLHEFYDKILAFVNCFNPFIAEPKTLLTAWGSVVLGVGIGLAAFYFLPKSDLGFWKNIKPDTNTSLPNTSLPREQQNQEIDRSFSQMKDYVDLNNNNSHITRTLHEIIDRVECQSDKIKKLQDITTKLHTRSTVLEKGHNAILTTINNPRRNIVPHSTRGLPDSIPFEVPAPRILTLAEKELVVNAIVAKSQHKPITWDTIAEVLREIIF